MALSDTLPAAPLLVLLSDATAGVDAVILGLSLRERAQRAGRRAGYAQVVAGQPPAADQSGGNLVVAPSDVLAEMGWLKSAATHAGEQWASGANLVLVPAHQTLAALRVLGQPGIAWSDLGRRLTEALGQPMPLPGSIEPMRVIDAADHRSAERRLLRALVKDTDGFMAKHVERPISLAISHQLAPTSITPNQMTLISVAFGLIGAPFFLSAAPVWQTIGALLFLTHSILDGCDGELARLKFMESRWGGVLDFWGDNVVHSAIFACMAIGWSWTIGAGSPLLLGLSAVLGTLGSAGFVYWRVMRPKTGSGPLYTSVSAEPGKGFTKLLDALSRRDFIYLVVALALFGRADWFLLLTSIGAPVFMVLLIMTAARESRR